MQNMTYCPCTIAAALLCPGPVTGIVGVHLTQGHCVKLWWAGTATASLEHLSFGLLGVSLEHALRFLCISWGGEGAACHSLL